MAIYTTQQPVPTAQGRETGKCSQVMFHKHVCSWLWGLGKEEAVCKRRSCKAASSYGFLVLIFDIY